MNIKLWKPVQGEQVSLLASVHKEFLRSGGNKKNGITFDYLNLVKQGEDRAFGEPVILEWKTTPALSSGQIVRVELSLFEDFSDSRYYCADEHELKVYNLFLGHTYFWRVHIIENSRIVYTSETETFFTENMAPRWIKAEGLSNIRDLGGWTTEDGRKIRQGLLYRGCEMEFHHTITEQGKHVLLDELCMKTDLDIRGEAVGKVDQSALGENVNFVLLPLTAYGEIISCKKEYATIFKMLTQKENYPFYIHCWGGADRTGTLVFIICAILGMSMENLCMDYELTSFSIWGERSSSSDLFVSLLKLLDTYGSPKDTIRIKCENFLLSIGITRDELEGIRRIMLES